MLENQLSKDRLCTDSSTGRAECICVAAERACEGACDEADYPEPGTDCGVGGIGDSVGVDG